jgi:hypothetical protein
MSYPLLELEDVRIDCNGQCVLESLSLRSSGDRIGLLGQGRFLFDALAGSADIVAGRLQIRGVEFERARESSLFAVARPWPTGSNVTVRDGLILSALLGGCMSSAAKRRADRAIEALGLGQLARQKLVRRPKVEQYLAGLAEAALFEPEIIVVDWPIGLLDPDGWVRFGTALSRLIQHKRWLAWVPGPARLSVEQSWIGALDQLLWVENGLSVEFGATAVDRVRCLVVIDAALDQLPEGLDQEGIRLEPIRLAAPFGERRRAFVVELARDEFGRPCSEPLLAYCDRHGLPLFRLEPLDRGF